MYKEFACYPSPPCPSHPIPPSHSQPIPPSPSHPSPPSPSHPIPNTPPFSAKSRPVLLPTPTHINKYQPVTLHQQQSQQHSQPTGPGPPYHGNNINNVNTICDPPLLPSMCTPPPSYSKIPHTLSHQVPPPCIHTPLVNQ